MCYLQADRAAQGGQEVWVWGLDDHRGPPWKLLREFALEGRWYEGLPVQASPDQPALPLAFLMNDLVDTTLQSHLCYV